MWSGKEQMAFEDLKTAVTTAPVLVSSQDLEPFWVEARDLGEENQTTNLQFVLLVKGAKENLAVTSK